MTVSLYFPGKIRNITLSPKQGLLPVYEAISNSIDAINESKVGNYDGNIQIVVHRATGSLLQDDEQQQINPIRAFEIIDNGVGFDSVNFESFSLSHTPKKWSTGGKGEGRFLWLKVFDNIHIESTFDENGQCYHREFYFVLEEDPLPASDHDVITVSDCSLQTNVRLNGLKDEYSQHIPRRLKSIADRMIDHFLAYFVLDRMPNVSISDESDHISLNELYLENIADQYKVEFEIENRPFTMYHFLVKAGAGTGHQIQFCANDRVVDSIQLDSKSIPNLPSRIPTLDGHGNLIYVSYLLSPVLDESVNLMRTGFNLPRTNEGEIKFGGEVYWDEIQQRAIDEANKHLAPTTEPIRIEKKEKIQDYIYNGGGVAYRSLYKHHPEAMDQIPPNLDGAKLEIELFKAKRKVEENLREQSSEILQASDDALADPDDEIYQKYDEILEQLNDFSKDALAEYVLHRRRTLELLQRYMEMGEDGKHAREAAIHKLIFPIRSTSDDVEYEQQNLWIIDEKLSFHRYLSSDIPLKKVEVIDSDYNERPDLLFFFDRPIAIVEGEPKDSVTIFEFKRPMREDGADPVDQMNSYVRKLREREARTPKNRIIEVNESTPFYCYAICDITKKLNDKFTITHKMTKTPDGGGFFSFHPHLNAYVEVIGYDKLLRDAHLRNKILFDKLSIHS